MLIHIHAFKGKDVETARDVWCHVNLCHSRFERRHFNEAVNILVSGIIGTSCLVNANEMFSGNSSHALAVVL